MPFVLAVVARKLDRARAGARVAPRFSSAPPIVHVNEAAEALLADELERNADILRAETECRRR